MAEAFQLTAAERAEHPAIRTKGDEFTITWGGYADRVRSVAAGLAALGVGHGDTVGLMLTNRPEFHFADTAAIHLGATPFSIYNTSTPEQISYLLEDAGNRVLFTEQALLDTVLAARDAASSALETIVVVDGEARDGAITLAELEGGGGEEFDFEAAWRAVETDDILTLIYTSGTTGPPKGVQLDARETPWRRWTRSTAAARLPRRPPRLLAADGPRRRAQLHPVPADDPWADDHLLPGPAPGGRLPGRSAADLVLRGAADLGETEGGDGDRVRRRVGRGPQGGRGRGARSRDEKSPRRAGRRNRAARTRAGIREGRRGGPLRPAGPDRARQGRGGQRRRRADARAR